MKNPFKKIKEMIAPSEHQENSGRAPIIRVRDGPKMYDHAGHLKGFVGLNGKVYRKKVQAIIHGGGLDTGQRKEWREI